MRLAGLVVTAAAGAAAAVVAGCRFPADFQDTHYQCPDGKCPSGYSCVATQCVRAGSGDGGAGDAADAADAPPDAPATCAGILATSQEFVCAAIGATGAVKCWGRGDTGELGDGMATNSPMPVTAAGVTAPASLAVGGRHALALVGGALYAWGFDGQNQLGDGMTAEHDTPFAVPGAPTDLVSVGAGARGSCGLHADGTVTCWGCVGYLTNSATAPHCSTIDMAPTGLPLPRMARELSVGGQHACARLDDGSVWCAGRNDHGQLGDGTLTTSLNAVQVGGLAGATAVSAGRRHTCAIAGGLAYCWGSNDGGQIGDGTMTDRPSPVRIAGLTAVTQISAGGHHTCALAGGTPYCWGADDYGQIGDGTSGTNMLTPTPVVGLTPPVVEIRAGKRFSCARDGAGVECWGWNMHGTLGWATAVDTLPHPVPMAVPLGCQ